MLKSLKLRNFKGFKSQELTLKPVTLLAGLNSSGKSSVIQALLLLRQIEDDSHNPGHIRLNLQGPYARLGTGRDVLCESAEEDELEIGVTFEDGVKTGVSFSYDATGDRLHAPMTRRSEDDPLVRLKSMHYLCAERWGPRVTYPLSKSEAENGVGTTGELAYHYLLLHRDEKIVDSAMSHPNAKTQGLLSEVQAWLGGISPGVRIDIREVPEADLAIPKFGFERTKDVASSFYRPTNVGFGLSYSLPIITVLLSAAAGSIVLLENPEAHLHPRGQSELARLIALASKRLQIVVETHSDHLMNGIRVAVKEGVLLPDDVQFLYLRRADGHSIVETPIIDANGRLSFWPEGFFDESERTLAALISRKSKS